MIEIVTFFPRTMLLKTCVLGILVYFWFTDTAKDKYSVSLTVSCPDSMCNFSLSNCLLFMGYWMECISCNGIHNEVPHTFYLGLIYQSKSLFIIESAGRPQLVARFIALYWWISFSSLELHFSLNFYAGNNW